MWSRWFYGFRLCAIRFFEIAFLLFGFAFCLFFQSAHCHTFFANLFNVSLKQHAGRWNLTIAIRVGCRNKRLAQNVLDLLVQPFLFGFDNIEKLGWNMSRFATQNANVNVRVNNARVVEVCKVGLHVVENFKKFCFGRRRKSHDLIRVGKLCDFLRIRFAGFHCCSVDSGLRIF
ncbi:hypothetical protein D3C71_1668680 [compost metagenome]